MERTLYIQTFGGLALIYEGRYIPVECSGATKMLRLLVEIILAGQSGVERGFLIEDLYPEETSMDKAAVKLRVNFYRLRQFLTENGMPGENCILKEGSRYKWNTDIVPVDVDLWHFMRLYREIQENRDSFESQKEKLKQISLLYQGDFWPALTGCEWVTGQRAVLQEIYLKCREELENQELMEAGSSFSVVKEFLRKQEMQKGACLCGRTSFLDACRITKDRNRRLGGNANLMFCTVSCDLEKVSSDWAIREASVHMRQAAGVLRRSDFYTDFGQGNFMFLLTGAGVKPIDCGRTRERLEDAFWRDFPNEHVTLHFVYETL